MTGKTIAHYKVGEKLGAGGMGVVYQATDTKLNRQVALKILPEQFARDKDRMARFEREAQLLASLNHPNIAAIYGLEREGDTHALVLELVGGPTLEEQIKLGPIAQEESLKIAKQIADALEAAHDQNIIHRDLKPANVKVREDGQVKVLDFGLAKALEDPQSDPDMSNSPTLSVAATKAGIIIGTAAYMSPEQAKGKTADRRADVWAFGVVLYEMLTGQRIFTGETISEVLAHVITKEPDWDALPEETPHAIRKLLSRCLQKEPKQRLQAIGEARIALAEYESDSAASVLMSAPDLAAAQQPGWRRALPWVVLGLFGLAVIVATIFGPTDAEAPLLKFETTLTRSGGLGNFAPKLSPDGRKLLYRNDGKLWIREINKVEPREIPGGDNSTDPFWSHDSEWVAYFEGTKMWKAPTDGGERSLIAELPEGVSGGAGGGAWMPDGRIIYSTGDSGLMVVPAQGGDATALLEPGEGDDDFHEPSALPDGRGVVFVVHRDQGADTLAVFDGSDRKTILHLEDSTLRNPTYSSTGHILYRRSGTNDGLWALPFSISSLAPEGEPFMVNADGTYPSASLHGELTYVAGNTLERQAQLSWMDRDGKLTEITSQQEQLYPGFSLSPDGKRIVYSSGEPGSRDLWIYDTERGTRTRLTFEDGSDTSPDWHPDGESVVYEAPGTGANTITVRRADGTGESVKIADGALPLYSPDGRYVLYSDPNASTLVYTDLEDAANPVTLIDAGAPIGFGRVSPGGEYIAYTSLESGRPEVYIKKFPSGEGRWQVSTNVGFRAQWSADGRRLYYRSSDDIMEVSVTTRPSLRLGNPRAIFTHSLNREVNLAGRPADFAVSPDGQRVLLAVLVSDDSDEEAEDTGTPLIFIQNWFAEFREND